MINNQKRHIATRNQDHYSRHYGEEWGLSGCGWKVWDYPVELEPPYYPYISARYRNQSIIDDGKKDSLSVTLGKWVSKPFAKKNFGGAEATSEEQKPKTFAFGESLKELQCSIPLESRIKIDAARDLLLTLPNSNNPTVFEIISTSNEIQTQFVSHANADGLRQHIKGYFPDVVLTDPEYSLVEKWHDTSQNTLILELGLTDSFYITLTTSDNFEVDPLIPVFSALENVKQGELGIIQVMFQPAQGKWKDGACNVLEHIQSKAGETARSSLNKVRQPLFSVVLRIAVQAHSEERTKQLARSLVGAFKGFHNPAGNSFIPLDNKGYPDPRHIRDLLQRKSLLYCGCFQVRLYGGRFEHGSFP
ncbi:MAG: hypothetical protein AAF391_00170, partial [Bacteroidota bacterium]